MACKKCCKWTTPAWAYLIQQVIIVLFTQRLALTGRPARVVIGPVLQLGYTPAQLIILLPGAQLALAPQAGLQNCAHLWWTLVSNMACSKNSQLIMPVPDLSTATEMARMDTAICTATDFA